MIGLMTTYIAISTLSFPSFGTFCIHTATHNPAETLILLGNTGLPIMVPWDGCGACGELTQLGQN